MSPTQPPRRFKSVIDWLNDLKRTRPECDSEVEVAKGIILGKRPNIDEKYDALLLKLDRSITQMEDRRDYFKKLKGECVLAKERTRLSARIAELNRIIHDLTWMKARNRDMIEALNHQPEDSTGGPE